MQAVFLDITERKKAEKAIKETQEKFKKAFEASPDACYIGTLEDGVIIEVNDAFLQTWGYSRDECVGKTYLQLGLYAKGPPERQRVLNELRTKGHFNNLEFDGKRKNGEVFPLLFSGTLFESNGEKLIYGILVDITDRKRTETELRETLELLERVGEGIDAGLAVIGKDYRVVWANKRLMDLGVTPNKKCYQTFNNTSMICPDCGVKKIFEQNVPQDVHEFKTTGSNGESVWIELRVTPLKDTNGVIIAALELAVPITERKKTEESLIQSETKFRIYLENSPIAIFVVNAEGKYEYANEAASKLLGYSPKELSSIGIPDVVFEEELQAIIKDFSMLQENSKTVSEVRLKKKDGQAVYVRLNTVKLTDGKVITFGENVSERRNAENALQESEKRSRAIVANSPIGIATSDVDKRFLSANEAFCKILGYTEEELQKLTFQDITHPADLKESLMKMCELEDGCASSFLIEKRYVKKDRTTINGRIMVSAIRDQEGKPTLFVAELEDITERKKAEERREVLERKVNEYSKNLKYLVDLRTAQLKDANERLVKSERLAAIGELAGMVGHDLRNPLTGIKNAAYYLKKKGASISEVQAKEMLEIIDKAVSHSDKIINDLLEYSREMHLDLTKYPAHTLVNEALGMIQVPDRIQILNHVNEELSIWANADKMMRVFINLIKNAIDAIPEEGKIHINSCETRDNIEIAFTDNGTGIPEETLQKLFSPLFTTKAQGMGFGLAICKRIVEAHKGTITVETEVNKGTTFTISLPREPKADVDDENNA